MFKGDCFLVTFKDESIKARFYEWATRGNYNFARGKVKELGIQMYFFDHTKLSSLLIIKHNWFFSVGWALKLGFNRQARNQKGKYQIKTLSKIDLLNIVYEGKI